MEMCFHVGVHGAGEDRIARWLTANRQALHGVGAEFVAREVADPILNEAQAALKGGRASTEMEHVMFDALAEDDAAQRLIFSRARYLGPPRRALAGTALLPEAGARMRALADLFPSARTTFFIGLRNPAVYIADLARKTDSDFDLGTPEAVRWAPALRRILEETGGRPLVLWCYEDMPLIFPEVMRRLAGLPSDAGPLEGDMSAAEAIMTPEGVVALAEALAGQGTLDVAGRRRLLAEVLRTHHDPQAIRLRIPLPGWTQERVDRMTADYDADMAEIAALPGVEFLVP